MKYDSRKNIVYNSLGDIFVDAQEYLGATEFYSKPGKSTTFKVYQFDWTTKCSIQFSLCSIKIKRSGVFRGRGNLLWPNLKGLSAITTAVNHVSKPEKEWKTHSIMSIRGTYKTGLDARKKATRIVDFPWDDTTDTEAPRKKKIPAKLREHNGSEKLLKNCTSVQNKRKLSYPSYPPPSPKISISVSPVLNQVPGFEQVVISSLSSLDELNDLERKIMSDETLFRVGNTFGFYGWTRLTQMHQNCAKSMRKLITDTVVAGVNWGVANDKKGFSFLEVANIVTNAVHYQFGKQKGNLSDIKLAIKDWLKAARRKEEDKAIMLYDGTVGNQWAE
ncbi:unnamed protein product [Allacma fusca]|uniref:DUF4806 domain-containing protein n=1 Tax=Allacma fusca TaxID=39272 RepID=A0A8J2PA65_9HEXA|nr:unnamed protein product [Allacma fusca]